MKILGIDTSSKVLSVALGNRSDILAEHFESADRRHSSILVPTIKKLIEKNNLSIKDIDMFVVGLGPGSFTGLRIGVSTVKGFGIATGKQCIGIASTDAMAMEVKEDELLIVPIIDAKRGNLYSAIYVKHKERLIRKSGFLLLRVNDLMKKIKKEPCVFLGNGIPIYGETIKKLNKNAIFLDERYWYPKASNLIKLALLRVERYKNTDLTRLKPIYLYPKDCQVRKTP